MQTCNEILNNNLANMSKYNGYLVSKVTSHTQPMGEMQFVESKSGDINLLYNYMNVHDSDNPIEEANNLLNSLSRNDSRDVVLIFGLGLGYTLKCFAENYKGTIIFIETNWDILRITLESVDFSKELESPKILIINHVEDIARHISKFFVSGGKVHFTSLNSYKILFEEDYKIISNKIQSVIPEEYTGGDLQINIGAGDWQKKGWKTLDCYRFSTFNADLRTTNPLPLENNVITKAFCSHCIEHIEDKHLENLLNELYRCMKPGAIFRVSCPDAQLAFDAYTKGDYKWFAWLKESNIGAMLVNTFVSYEYNSGGPEVGEETVKHKFETLNQEDFIKWCVSLKDVDRPYVAHTNGYTYEILSDRLKKAGFTNIQKSAYLQSCDSEFQSPDFDLHPDISLYVECYKP
jgi:SAM-dependent methyltransferase